MFLNMSAKSLHLRENVYNFVKKKNISYHSFFTLNVFLYPCVRAGDDGGQVPGSAERLHHPLAGTHQSRGTLKVIASVKRKNTNACLTFSLSYFFFGNSCVKGCSQKAFFLFVMCNKRAKFAKEGKHKIRPQQHRSCLEECVSSLWGRRDEGCFRTAACEADCTFKMSYCVCDDWVDGVKQSALFWSKGNHITVIKRPDY